MRWQRLHPLVTCLRCARWFRRFRPVPAQAQGRLPESHRARRTIVQPAQLSLLPDQVPAPPPVLLAQLPGPPVAEAIMLLTGLIQRTAPVRGRREGDD